MHDEVETTAADADANAAAARPACPCSKMQVARAVIGALLLTVMLANLIAFAAPEWAATLGSYLPASCGERCSQGECTSGGCCPGMTSTGLPTAVLDGHIESRPSSATKPGADGAAAEE